MEALSKKPNLKDHELKQLGAYNVMVSELQSVLDADLSALMSLDFLLGQYDHPDFFGPESHAFSLVIGELKTWRKACFSRLESSDRKSLIVLPAFVPKKLVSLIQELFVGRDLAKQGMRILLVIAQLQQSLKSIYIENENYLLVRYFSHQVRVSQGDHFRQLSLLDVLSFDFDLQLELCGRFDSAYHKLNEVFNELGKEQCFQKIKRKLQCDVNSPCLYGKFLDREPSCEEFEAHIDAKIAEWRELPYLEIHQLKLFQCFELQEKIDDVLRQKLSYDEFLAWCRNPENNLVFTTVLLPIGFPKSLVQLEFAAGEWLERREQQLSLGKAPAASV